MKSVSRAERRGTSSREVLLPGSFIAFIVIGALACVAFSASLIMPRSDDKQIARYASYILSAFAGLLVFLSSVTVVAANEVGILTNFGAWGGTKSSGLSMSAPWSTLDTFGTRNQKSVRDQADGNGSCVNVSFSGGSQGCADMTALYTIDESNAKRLWDQWKDFSKLNGDLIERQTDDAANTVYIQYTPLEARTTKRAELSAKLNEELKSRLDNAGVRLESVTLGDLHLPEKTQNQLNDLESADNKLSIANKGEEQAKSEARAAAARLQSLTPQELMVQCFNAAKEIKPTIFDCTGVGAGINVNVAPK